MAGGTSGTADVDLWFLLHGPAFLTEGIILGSKHLLLVHRLEAEASDGLSRTLGRFLMASIH